MAGLSGGSIKIDELAPRPWATQRIEDALGNPHTPMVLVRGDPGSGKSSLLLQFADEAPESSVVARISRAPGHSEPFDSVVLLSSIIEGITDLGVQVEGMARAPMSTEVKVDLRVDEVQSGGEVNAVVLNYSTTGGLLPVAERLIRSVPAQLRVLIVIDALDQAEDDGAEEFLEVSAALQRASVGTGVRLVCASRREMPIGFNTEFAVTFDLIGDAPETIDDLRDYLTARFDGLAPEDRDRVVNAILAGAAKNWLWAATNADYLEAEIDTEGKVPEKIQLTSGLEGLYQDGIRRMRQRVGKDWEPIARPLLNAISCAFDEYLTVTELRWITGQATDRLQDVARLCEPFLRQTDEGVRLFHPDFARWMLTNSVDGASEELGHLAVARGFTAFGRETKWGDDASNAASRVVDHWCTMLVLDPFSPSFHEYEQELDAVLTDPNWVTQASIGLDAVEQASLVAPTLRFPGSDLPLSAGLRVLDSSSAAQKLVGFGVLAKSSEDERAELKDIADPAQAIRWLEKEVPDYASVALRVLWGTVLQGFVTFLRVDGELRAFLSPDLILASVDNLDTQTLGRLESLLEEVADEHLEAMTERIRETIDAVDDETDRAMRHSLLGHVYRERATRGEGDAAAEDLTGALSNYREALALTPHDSDYRLTAVIDIANTLRDMEPRSKVEVDELITVQAELLEIRRTRNESGWPYSSNLLGDAYFERAREGGGLDEADLEKARLAYRDALTATPSDSDHRLMFAVDLANALFAIKEPSIEDLDELVVLQQEIARRRRAAGSPLRSQAVKYLGDAHMARAKQIESQIDGTDEGVEAAARSDRDHALAAYREALAATPSDSDNRIAYAIDLANTLFGQETRSDAELDELIVVQSEILDRRRAAEQPEWQVSAALLGRALQERANRKQESGQDPSRDLASALVACREALENTPVDGEQRPAITVSVSNILFALPYRSDRDLDELVEVQEEVASYRRAAEHDAWPLAYNLLGDAYLERAQRTPTSKDGEASAGDLEKALDAYRLALANVAPDSEQRLGFLLDVAHTLRELDSRTEEQVEELIDLLVDATSGPRDTDAVDWSYVVSILGDGYFERAQNKADRSKGQDLELALGAYREALAGAPTAGEQRTIFLLDIAKTLRELDDRTDEQMDEQVRLQEEAFAICLEAGVPIWPYVASLLGVAYRERATRDPDETTEDAAEAQANDMRRALTAFRDALAGTPTDSESRTDLAVEVANTLFALETRSDRELDELVAVQSEVLARRRQADSADWRMSAVLLGRALRERSRLSRKPDYDPSGDLSAALSVYRETLASTPSDSERRMVLLVDMTNTLRGLERRSETELEELIALQAELLSHRRDADHLDWPLSANLLGDAYRERARRRDEDAGRAEDLSLALDAHHDAFAAVTPSDERYLTFAIDLANTMVVLAAVTRRGSPQTLDEATELVAKAANGGVKEGREITRLLPVLRSALRRHESWASA